MIDDRLHPRDLDFELAQRLEAFAAARLSPSLDATIRMRTRVMREAHRVAGTLAPPTQLDPKLPRTLGSHVPAGRRVVPAFLAAAFVLLALAGTTVAAKPGGPLYSARIWAESAFLPAGGDARADAEVARLEERLREAVLAASSGDPAAVAAAVDAYRQIVDGAMAAAGDDPERAAKLEAALGKHLAVLEELLGKVPPQAQKGITNAIERSGQAADRIREHGPGAAPGRDPQGNGSGKPNRTPRVSPGKPPTTQP